MSTDTASEPPALPQDVSSLIDWLGGVRKVAEDGPFPIGTVSAWKTRGRIWSDNWPRVIEFVKSRGWPQFDANTLLAMHVGASNPSDDVAA